MTPRLMSSHMKRPKWKTIADNQPSATPSLESNIREFEKRVQRPQATRVQECTQIALEQGNEPHSENDILDDRIFRAKGDALESIIPAAEPAKPDSLKLQSPLRQC